MSKRNFTLLIIVLAVAGIVAFWFLYSRKSTTPTENPSPSTNFFSKFFPFKNSPNPSGSTPPPGTPAPEPSPTGEILAMKLKKISSMAVAGYGVYKKERLIEVAPPTPPGESTPNTNPTAPGTEFTTAVRYVARANGNIYQTFADKIEEVKFSGTVIPKIYEAYFGAGATSVVMRYLKADGATVETFAGNLPREFLGSDTTGENEVKGTFLPENISDVSISPDGSKVFYLFSPGDGVVGTTMSFQDGKKVQVFDSPFSEWLSSWPKSTMLSLTTKPFSRAPGYMYILDLDKKTFTKMLGPINGLTTLASPTGKSVLYGDNSLSLYIYHTDTGASDSIGLRTLPEKCVWSKVGDILYCAAPKLVDLESYPEAWYQGKVSWSDQVWKIDPTTGVTAVLTDPGTAAGEEIDATKLSLDAEESYLFFVNKKDSFLWELELK